VCQVKKLLIKIHLGKRLLKNISILGCAWHPMDFEGIVEERKFVKFLCPISLSCCTVDQADAQYRASL
jgi:hypothetical protein